MDENEVKAKVKIAIERLINEDHHLFTYNLNERTFTHRLAMYLQEEFADYQVDCEYNRNGRAPKKILKEFFKEDIIVGPDDTDSKTVYPDIIVHERGSNERNLLVIEAKKSTNPIDDELDLKKLAAFKADPAYKYSFSLFLRFMIEEHEVVLNWNH